MYRSYPSWLCPKCKHLDKKALLPKLRSFKIINYLDIMADFRTLGKILLSDN